ncbi:hypothetical protein JCM8547_005846 [Rhodosporidiobolus lusitaniae]
MVFTVEVVMNVNLNAVFLGVLAVIPSMLKQEARECGVRATSLALFRTLRSTARQRRRCVPYCASKGYGRQGIKCTTVFPGIIATALNAAELADPTKCINYRSQTPWPRFGRVDEVGSAVLFLASDASDYTNGTDILMDAGYVHA